MVKDNLKYDEERRKRSNRRAVRHTDVKANISWYTGHDDDQEPPSTGSAADQSLDLCGSRFIF